MKKLYLLLLVAVLALFTAACGDKSSTSQKSDDKDTLSIYTTVYPLSYFAQRIGGDFVEVSSIYPAGANEHTFEPTQKDMMKLADANIFFYIGLGLEGFVENAKKTLAQVMFMQKMSMTSIITLPQRKSTIMSTITLPQRESTIMKLMSTDMMSMNMATSTHMFGYLLQLVRI